MTIRSASFAPAVAAQPRDARTATAIRCLTLMNRSLSVPARAACALAFGVLAQSPAVADDAARISRLETEIQQLRAQLDEQNRRIQRLEAELELRAGVPQPR